MVYEAPLEQTLPVEVILVATSSPIPPVTPYTILQRYFGDKADIMMSIANCESNSRQFNDDGTVVTSITGDKGFLQISPIWASTAKENNLDYVYDLEDNIKMAKIVYDRQGLKAWVCYDNMIALKD